MKYCILLCYFSLSLSILSAQVKLKHEKTSIHYLTSSSSQEEALNYDDIPGSPYKYKSFRAGKVYFNLNDNPVEYKLNYNGYEDEVEYIDSGTKYTVTNQNDIKKITINNDILIYAKYYDGDVLNEGFFLEIIDDYISLYKKESISLVPIRKSVSSISINQEVIFSKQKEQYYLSVYGEPLILVKNKKELLELFFNHPAVKEFLKSERIKLRSEHGLKKFVAFLNTYDKNKMKQY